MAKDEKNDEDNFVKLVIISFLLMFTGTTAATFAFTIDGMTKTNGVILILLSISVPPIIVTFLWARYG